MQKWQCRVAPSIGDLEGTHHEVWGTEEYTEPQRPCVFFGLYGFNDFFTLWRHTGRRAILWAGSDITHFRNGYWLDEGGSIRLDYKALAKWMNETCENYVENVAEQQDLQELGIDTIIIPSFMGDVSEYTIEYQHNDTIKLYASVSGDNFDLYKWNEIEELAEQNPEIEFHLYGNRTPWNSPNKNVIVHGRITKEHMNAQIKHMHGGIRLLEHDGFSEIIAKSLLWGQYPISTIPYPHTLLPKDIGTIRNKITPNTQGRDWILNTVNKYPWNAKINQ